MRFNFMYFIILSEIFIFIVLRVNMKKYIKGKFVFRVRIWSLVKYNWDSCVWLCLEGWFFLWVKWESIYIIKLLFIVKNVNGFEVVLGVKGRIN